jgi:hypothetical protein
MFKSDHFQDELHGFVVGLWALCRMNEAPSAPISTFLVGLGYVECARRWPSVKAFMICSSSHNLYLRLSLSKFARGPQAGQLHSEAYTPFNNRLLPSNDLHR